MVSFVVLNIVIILFHIILLKNYENSYNKWQWDRFVHSKEYLGIYYIGYIGEVIRML